MNKLKWIVRGGMDGATMVTGAPACSQVEGWTQGVLDGPAGVLPAHLWGKVPGGDPYVLHVSVLTPMPLAAGDFFELQSGEPVQPRAQFQPTPGNTRLVLVRPSDRLRFLLAPQAEARIEMLVEPVGGVNELGGRLFEWATQGHAAAMPVQTVRYAGAGVVVAWHGQLHVVYEGAAAGDLSLPPRGAVPVGAMLTVTRTAAGQPTLVVANGDSIVGQGVMPVTRSAVLYNNGDEWTFVGM